MNDIKNKIGQYIKQEVSIEGEKIKDDTLIFKEGYLDSMGFMMLMTFIDETFGVKIIDKDMIQENFESINAITNFITEKL
jgi:acyl carrier protein